MNTYELLDELSKKDNREIQYCLMVLMEKKKLKYSDFNAAYVAFIECIKEDLGNRLVESETCVMESFMYKKTKDARQGKSDYNHTQRCLYLLNNSNRFNMDKENEKYKYDKEYAKGMSWYERNKKENYV